MAGNFTAPISVLWERMGQSKTRVEALRAQIEERLKRITEEKRGDLVFEASAYDEMDSITYIIRTGVIDDVIMEGLRRDFPGCSMQTRGTQAYFVVPKRASMAPAPTGSVTLERAGYAAGMALAVAGMVFFSNIL